MIYSVHIVKSGGWTSSSLSEVLRYDPNTDHWVKTGDLYTPRDHHGASAVTWEDIEPFCVILLPGGKCWSQSSGYSALRCSPGTECLPWLPDGGTLEGISAKYCLHSPPLAEGDSCDYDQMTPEVTHLCQSGLRCDDGLCQGTDTHGDPWVIWFNLYIPFSTSSIFVQWYQTYSHKKIG